MYKKSVFCAAGMYIPREERTEGPVRIGCTRGLYKESTFYAASMYIPRGEGTRQAKGQEEGTRLKKGWTRWWIVFVCSVTPLRAVICKAFIITVFLYSSYAVLTEVFCLFHFVSKPCKTRIFRKWNKRREASVASRVCTKNQRPAQPACTYPKEMEQMGKTWQLIENQRVNLTHWFSIVYNGEIIWK